MSEWTKISSEAANDKRLKDGEVRTLLKLCSIAWDIEKKPETPLLHWREFVDLLRISKASFFRHIHLLEAMGYIRSEKSGSRLGSERVRYFILTREPVRPSSSLIDTNKDSKREEELRRRSLVLTRENEIFKELREAGIGEPLRSKLAEDPEIDLEYVRAHIKYAKHRSEPRRYLANRLSSREPVPTAAEFAEIDPDSEEARARYLKEDF